MLLNIYLASTGACIAVDVISTMAIINKLKRDGYEIVKENKSISEFLVDVIIVAAAFAVPVINILFSAGFIAATDLIYDEFKDSFIKEGVVKRIEDHSSVSNNADIEKRLKAITEERDTLLRQKEILEEAMQKAKNIQGGVSFDADDKQDDVFFHEGQLRKI